MTVALRLLSIDRYVHQLLESIRQEPVLDGIDHAGQAILCEAFARDPAAAAEWALALVQDRSQESFAADTLRLLCRIKPSSSDWRRTMVETALRSPSPTVRDASIQAVESWADPDLIAALRRHFEPDRFLSDYAAQVLRDLGAVS